MKIFTYINLGSAIYTCVVSVIVLVGTPGKLSGGDLLDAVRPALQAVTAAFPKARVPETLAAQITDGIAAAVNQYYHRG